MSALARYFNARGKNVSGYDKTPTPLTQQLINEGIEIHFEENIKMLPEKIDLVVYTPAIPSTHTELKYFKENGYEIKKRSEVLGLLTKDNFTIAVAGTHGKTTISSMLAHIFKSSGINILGFIGGITQNYDSNFFNSENFKAVIVEADEYDRSFLQLHPDIAVISSMDADHLDIYGDKNYMLESYNLFAKQIKKNGKLIYKKSLPVAGNTGNPKYQYSAFAVADYYAERIKKNGAHYKFYFNSDELKNEEINLQTDAFYNVENAVAAIAVCLNFGLNIEQIKSALASYKGVKRRFEYQVKSDKIIYIDDYAHHPEELKACINSVKKLYPGKKITGVFQPHLYTRTRDFADEFARSLELLDELILLEIYPARELPIEGVSSKMLFNKVNINNKSSCSKEQLVDILKNKKTEIILTLGAGDIDQLVIPIKEMLLGKYKIKNV
jgi:UDP-N-acetylmuramate--alanine ligase